MLLYCGSILMLTTIASIRFYRFKDTVPSKTAFSADASHKLRDPQDATSLTSWLKSWELPRSPLRFDHSLEWLTELRKLL